MKIRSLARQRATWRAHFLAIAREAPAPAAHPPRFVRAGLKPRVRAVASAIRSRVLAAAPAA